MAEWFGDWDCPGDVEESFGDPIPEGAEVLIAAYDIEWYNGNAYVLFRVGGAFYEVVGGHCSCNGLEDQWAPEETTLAAIRLRLNDGTFFDFTEGLGAAVERFLTSNGV